MVGDWAAARPGLRPGGWAFQYENPHYPDLDDTAAAGLALDRFDAARYRHALDRAAEWIVGMQSRNGGWAAFDADNTHYLLNNIPFADHGALLDPPTADVSARCLGFLAQLGYERRPPRRRRGARLSAARTGERRQLVRPVGNQLHLRNLVGPRGLQRDRHRFRRAGGPPRRGMAACPAAPRWRLGRTRRDLLARRCRMARRPTAPPRRRPGPCSA